MSGPQKRRRQATADPESETTSSDSDSSSTVDTSTSEGEDEKDFILPDYPSDELTSSESSDSEPEEAPAENLSTGWSERVTRVDTQFHGDHVGPPKHPRPHQPREHRTFLPRAVPRRRFLGASVPPNKPASRAGQAVQARFILCQEF